MRKTYSVILIIIAIGIFSYPLWGVLQPESYRAELAENYPYSDTSSTSQLKQASSWLFLPNGVLAAAIFLLSIYLRNPERVRYAYSSTVLIAIYPFFKSYSSAEMGFIMTSSSSNPEYIVEMSSTGFVYALFGFIIFSIVRLHRGV